MKTHCWTVLALSLSTALLAQPASNFPPAAPAAAPAPLSKSAVDKIDKMTPLFDGKTLNGWIQFQNNATTFSGGDIADLGSLARKLSEKSDLVSAFLSERLDEALKADLAAYSPASTNAKALRSALAKNLNKIVSGPSLYAEARFQKAQLSRETEDLRQTKPQGRQLSRLNKLLIEEAYPAELKRSVSAGWTVKDGVMASTGADRGVICTASDYTYYRVVFKMRHVSGNHQACVLVFCTRPAEGENPLDALGGIQFQVPNGGHWDYRPGHNNGGTGFASPTKTKFDPTQWSQVEILVNAPTGTARMAVAQPVGAKGIENLDFKAPEAGKTGPLAWQIHNAGLFDEFKDVRIEIDPKEDRLLTVE